MIRRLITVLVAFAAAAYGRSLTLPFIGDDYVFIDRTRYASFAQLWSFQNVDFNWYRPWSRELHFWLLQRVVGLHEVGFRVFGVILWIAGLCLYASVVRRVSTQRVAWMATLGATSLALWGSPLLWISGSQDLWMVLFTMASLLLFISNHPRWSLLPYVLALLSKETAAIVPALLCAYSLFVERRTALEALRRTLAFWIVTSAWALVHPVLHARILGHGNFTQELEHRPPTLMIILKTVLSTVNLDVLPHPQEVTAGIAFAVLASTAIMGVAAWRALRSNPAAEPSSADRQPVRSLAHWALAWTLIGWMPVLLPSIAWHAYYGCLGALGAWFAIALALDKRPVLAVPIVMGLVLLRGAQANTLTWDWGNEAYQRRAGNILSAIRDDVLRQHPHLPPYSRLYFAHIPNNIGLVAGQSPAARVWYGDSTLKAGFFSSYRPRSAGEPQGEDIFFRFDTSDRMVEIYPGLEDVATGLRTNRHWESDHEELGALFLEHGDVPRAALEFEKISLLRHRPDAAVWAAVCWETLRDSARADSLYRAVRMRTGISDTNLAKQVARLGATSPGR